jgi:hypothetical protein
VVPHEDLAHQREVQAVHLRQALERDGVRHRTPNDVEPFDGVGADVGVSSLCVPSRVAAGLRSPLKSRLLMSPRFCLLRLLPFYHQTIPYWVEG